MKEVFTCTVPWGVHTEALSRRRMWRHVSCWRIPGVLLCTLGCIIPSFCICLALAHFYYKYRSFSGVQTVLSALRPAVVALIASAGLSILLLGVFQSDLAHVALSNFRWIEAVIFAGALFILRKFRPSAIAVIFGSGVVGTAAYLLLGLA